MTQNIVLEPPAMTGLLSDDALLDALRRRDIVIDGIDPARIDPYEKDSQIQPSSIDLMIGEIYVPASEEDRRGGQLDRPPVAAYSIEPSETVVVKTRERISLGRTISAFGFPPAVISRDGILMTNPGHIDPGFSGHLTFTLINMGRTARALARGLPVVTLLFHRLQAPVGRDYADRRPGGLKETSPALTARNLSRDFLNMREGARTAAIEEVKQQALAIRRREGTTPIIIAVITGLSTLLAAAVGGGLIVAGKADRTEMASTNETLNTLRADLEFLKGESASTSKIPAEIATLVERIRALEEKKTP